MKLRKGLAALAGVALAGTMLMASPARATELGNTDVTFTLVNGLLSIAVDGASSTVAATKDLGSLTPDGTLSQVEGDLVSTTVTDNRNSLSSVYTVSGDCDDFVDLNSNTIDETNVTVSVGSLTDATLAGQTITPSGLFTPVANGAACGATASPIGARVSSGALTTLLGTLTGATSANNSVTYMPHIVVTVPPNTPDGEYSTTVYQTVA